MNFLKFLRSRKNLQVKIIIGPHAMFCRSDKNINVFPAIFCQLPNLSIKYLPVSAQKMPRIRNIYLDHTDRVVPCQSGLSDGLIRTVLLHLEKIKIKITYKCSFLLLLTYSIFFLFLRTQIYRKSVSLTVEIIFLLTVTLIQHGNSTILKH